MHIFWQIDNPSNSWFIQKYILYGKLPQFHRTNQQLFELLFEIIIAILVISTIQCKDFFKIIVLLKRVINIYDAIDQRVFVWGRQVIKSQSVYQFLLPLNTYIYSHLLINIIFDINFPPFLEPMLYQDSLRYYYQNFYPYELIEKWLTYNSKYPFNHRQLSFEFDDNIVQRYVTFLTFKEMKSRMINSETPPRKVDAGAIWTGIPTKDNKEEKTIERQFVFDFDMNDYDQVRTCCEGKKVCADCWKLLIIAAQILTTSLSDDFGFQKLMYVFSGGRGMHIWVCDQRARKMSDQVRKSSVDYLEVVTANDKANSLLADGVFRPHFEMRKLHDDRQAARQQILRNMHPHIRRSLVTVKKWFTEIFEQQKTLTTQKCREIIYKILRIRNQKLMERVKDRWSKCTQSHQKLWEELCDQVDHYQKTKGDQYPLKPHELDRKYKTITFIEEEIMLSFLYPRMDYNVSTMQNHLLKLPFSVHPSSKKISVPMFYHQIQNFDPKTCITLDDLMKQLDDMQNDEDINLGKGTGNIEKALKTKLYEYINPLNEFIKTL